MSENPDKSILQVAPCPWACQLAPDSDRYISLLFALYFYVYPSIVPYKGTERTIRHKEPSLGFTHNDRQRRHYFSNTIMDEVFACRFLDHAKAQGSIPHSSVMKHM